MGVWCVLYLCVVCGVSVCTVCVCVWCVYSVCMMGEGWEYNSYLEML